MGKIAIVLYLTCSVAGVLSILFTLYCSLAIKEKKPQAETVFSAAQLECTGKKFTSGETISTTTKIIGKDRHEIIENLKTYLKSKGVVQSDIAKITSPQNLYRMLPLLDPELGDYDQLIQKFETYLNSLPNTEKNLLATNEGLQDLYSEKFYIEQLGLVESDYGGWVTSESSTTISYSDKNTNEKPPWDFLICSKCGSSAIGGCLLGGCVEPKVDISVDLPTFAIDVEGAEISWTWHF